MRTTPRTLRIPKPCHENWNRMSDTEKGKFCTQCSKHVVDFTQLPDSEILKHFQNKNEKVCGRFTGSQLNRALSQPVVKDRLAFSKLLAGLLLFSSATPSTGSPQRLLMKMYPDTHNTHSQEPAAYEAQTALPKDSVKITITGTVIDSKTAKRIKSVSIRVSNSETQTKTNRKGEFTITVNGSDFKEGFVFLAIYKKGYMKNTIFINQAQPLTKQDVQLSKERMSYGEAFLD